MKLKVRHFFDASHQLPDTPDLISKGCARLHGHTYAVIVELEGDNSRNGMVVDFKAVKDVIDTLDHQHINSIFEQKGIHYPPTAENIAIFLVDLIEIVLKIPVVKLSICEGYKGVERSSWVIYQPE